MRFVNREKELEYVKDSISLSKRKLFTLSVFGLRRVGKTRLILQSLKKDDIYFFVNKNKSGDGLLREYEEMLKAKNILNDMESLNNWEDFFKTLFERYKGVLVFDEFQNFVFVDKSVFGILQKYLDLNENRKGILFIFSGSTTGLVKKLFSDAKEPLYGRLKRSLHLNPLDFSCTANMCREVDIKDLSEIINLYALFGGFPKYYVSIEDENLNGKRFEEVLERFLFAENALLEDEVSSILSLEFGRRSGIYYDILTAVANGCTRISEIASFLRRKETALTRQIDELVNYFGFIGVEKQIIGKKRLFYINHPLINFWFKYFFKNISSYKKREEWLIKKIKKEINTHVGHRFEYVCREFLNKNKDNLPFTINKIGRQWGKIKNAPKGQNTYEIDIVAINEDTNEILFCECKWKEKVDANKVLEELKEKATHVDWNNEKRKEKYCIFAKSFKNKDVQEEAILYDLKDLEKIFSKKN